MAEHHGTSTLADALLDDLDDLSDTAFGEETEQNESAEANDVAIRTGASDEEYHPPQLQLDHDDDDGDRKRPALSSSSSFLQNPALQKHLQIIRDLQSSSTKHDNKSNNNGDATVSGDASYYYYPRIVQSNQFLSQLTDELMRAHARLCLAYHAKFPELEELLPHPVQYKQAVQIIGNSMDVSDSNILDALAGNTTTTRDSTSQKSSAKQSMMMLPLTNNQILTLSVAGSTTMGRPLTDAELERVQQACQEMDDLLHVQHELTHFVQSRMQELAPSVCALLLGPNHTSGSSGDSSSRSTDESTRTGVAATAASHQKNDAMMTHQSTLPARIVALAGGLEELSKIPACNLQVLGQVKQNAASRAGFSNLHGAAATSTTTTTTTSRPHQGILSECDLVQQCPKALQKKALKAVAAKLALAARCDYVNLTTGRPRDATPGQHFYHEIQTKIQQWQEPDKAPVLKALPK